MPLETVVCTIMSEGSPRMNQLVLATADNLKKFREETGARVFCSFIGRPYGEIYDSLTEDFKGAFNRFESTPPVKSFRPDLLSKKISGLIRDMFDKAQNSYFPPESIFYMEGDKPDVVDEIERIVKPIHDEEANIVLAERSEEGYRAFPFVQKIIENKVDKTISYEVGMRLDYTYGPRAFDLNAASYVQNYPNQDWGILTYPIVAGSIHGLKISGVELSNGGFPQKDYMSKYGSAMKIPGIHLTWRMIQNMAHLKAIELAKQKCQLSLQN